MGEASGLFLLSTRCKILIVLCLIMALAEILFFVVKWDPFHGNYEFHRVAKGGVTLSKELQDQLDRRLKEAEDKKFIIMWAPPHWEKRSMPFTVDRARCGNCEVTRDREKINNETVCAIVFHSEWINEGDMPPSRRDSDFYYSYNDGVVAEALRTNTLKPEFLIKLKTKMAVAVVSDCDVTPGALIRYNMLKELESLDFGLENYGACFPGILFAGKQGEIFTSEVRKYKFYFSFENSHHCKDYITEKFFRNALVSLTVPVVWGATKKDYEAVAPPGSFIFAEDFSSLKELSQYLKYLDENDTAYLEYFRWITMKPSEMPYSGIAQGYCQICRALHGINIDDIYNPKFDETNMKRPLFANGVSERSVNLSEWFYGEENPECFYQPSNFFNFRTFAVIVFLVGFSYVVISRVFVRYHMFRPPFPRAK